MSGLESAANKTSSLPGIRKLLLFALMMSNVVNGKKMEQSTDKGIAPYATLPDFGVPLLYECAADYGFATSVCEILAPEMDAGLPKQMLDQYRSNKGTQYKDPAKVKDELFSANKKLDPHKLETAMQTYTTEVVYLALEHATHAVKSRDYWDSLHRCLLEETKPGPRNEGKRANEKDPSSFDNYVCKPSPEQMEAIIVAQLAFAQLFTPYSGLKKGELAPVQMAAFGSRYGQYQITGHTTSVWAPTLLQLILGRQTPIKSTVHLKDTLPPSLTMSVGMHELLHVNEHLAWKNAFDDLPPIIHEALTEMLTTASWTGNPLDTGYEQRGSHAYAMHVLAFLAQSCGHSEGTEEAYAAGKEVLKKAYLSGDEEALKRTLEGVKRVKERFPHLLRKMGVAA
jgi:hypothetical protein